MRRDPAADEAELRRLIEENTEAYNRGDAAAFLSYIAEDRIALNPEQDPMLGRGDEDELQRFMDSVEQSAELIIDELQVFGDCAFERGRGVGTLAPRLSAGGLFDPTTKYRYKYIRIWRRREGEWRVYRTIWNHDEPTPKVRPFSGNEHL